jgi:hypothetical protein
MTEIGSAVSSGTFDGHAYAWILTSPTTGNQDLYFSFPDDQNAGIWIMDVVGGDTTTPTSGVQTGTGSGPNTSLTVTSATGDIVVDVLALQYTYRSPNVGSGQTEFTAQALSDTEGVASNEAGATSVTMSWTSINGDPWAHLAFNVKAGSGGGGSGKPSGEYFAQALLAGG